MTSDEAARPLLEGGSFSPRGLPSEEARERLLKDGPNALPDPPKPNPLRQILAQFQNPIVLTLVAAAVVAIVNGARDTSGSSFLLRYGDATAILLIVTLNAVLGFYQERQASSALDALQKMQTPNARVRRDGKVTSIAASQLVVGDVVELEAGDAIPADGYLVDAVRLSIEEASITGESVPVAKSAGPLAPDETVRADKTHHVFAGTSVVQGKGRAVIVATGLRTELGKLSTLIENAGGDRATPLENQLEHFGKRVLMVCLGLSVLLFVRGLAKGGRSWSELLLEAVSLAVAAIPEGLPAITTITLALGMQRMAKRGAIVRKLAAVETLGAATVICTDKTGTLTQNQMTVREIHVANTNYLVSGAGYDLDGDIRTVDGSPVEPLNPPLHDLITTLAICNTAVIEPDPNGGYRVVGDPTEGALLILAAKGQIRRSDRTVLEEIPFDSDRKRMTIITNDESGREIAHTKGSADVLLPRCTHRMTNDGPVLMDDVARNALLAETERMARLSLRVLAATRRDLTPNSDSRDARHEPYDPETNLTFMGLVGMMDPPRPEAKKAVEACIQANIRVVMITGDHLATAVSIAEEIGIWTLGATALTGYELEQMTDDTLGASIEAVRVFARVSAEQKLRIVRLLKSKNHVVAMTGDGVNDSPALREAHIGIAMGRQGTDVARQAADMVLADDNFATIVEAVREGRAVYKNIQKFVYFLLASNAGLVVAVFVASFMPRLLPLTPLMILWINLVTNGLPALALGIDPPDASQMKERPRRSDEPLLGRRELAGIAVIGLVMGAAALFCQVGVSGPDDGLAVLRGRAVAFSLLALSPLFFAFACRSASASIAKMRPIISRSLVVAVLLSAAIHFVSVLVPAFRPVFRTYTMSATEWAMLLVLSLVIVPTTEVFKWIANRT